MRGGFVRSFVVGAFVLGVAAAGALIAAAPASAVGVIPVRGGYQVDLTHDETVWVKQNNIGQMAAGLPHPSAASFGTALATSAAVAADYPQGRVSFTVFDPLGAPSGTMVAYKE